MTRIAAVLTAVVVIVAGAVPVAADRAEDLDASCATVGPLLCEPLEQVLSLLAPFQPVLDLTTPLLMEGGKVVNDLTRLALSGPGVPAAELDAAASTFADQLRSVPEPLARILDVTGQRQALIGALDQLVAALRALPAPISGVAPGPAPAEERSPEPAPEPAPAQPKQVGSTSSSGPTAFGSPRDAGTVDGAPGRRPTSLGPVPGVPHGGTLDLSPYSLPAFGLDSSTNPAARSATAESARQALADLVLPAAQGATAIDQTADGNDRALGVLAALSALLVAAGLLAGHVRRQRHVIPD